ncbi:hypothetical protein Kirov_223 [Bacillus phage Kirov]|uniref:Uncharacterized protein n=1 Tax=Bacillus phage Kirov TaxID=2783539 RepID=A0A7U3RZ32_9CAUD|nr:hypothetical protein PQE67_gp081 [Bacillus phage Kirov]QOV08422.1 hypothetical protein Kirov_223 [Bacillus phage Kirov]
MEVNKYDRAYFDKLDWEEVPMWKALKLWGNNQKHLRYVSDDGNHYCFYHGQSEMTIRHSQVKSGKWYVRSEKPKK